MSVDMQTTTAEISSVSDTLVFTTHNISDEGRLHRAT